MAEEKEKPIEKDQRGRPQFPSSKEHQKGPSATIYEKIGWMSHHIIEKIVARYKS
jgi:hypothetical protein